MSNLYTCPRRRLRCSTARVASYLVLGSLAMQSFFGIASADEPTKPDPISTAVVKPEWRPLEGAWESIHIGGEGKIKISKEVISLAAGDPITAVRWTGDLPTDNYEVEFEGRRMKGFDFFCAMTFPIGKEHASLVLGGWGGGVVGLSSINGADASENETTQYKPFENETWYKIRVRVTPTKVECLVDGSSIVDVEREDRMFGTRFEMDSSKPLGIAAYQCDSEFRNLKLRKLGDDAASTLETSP